MIDGSKEVSSVEERKGLLSSGHNHEPQGTQESPKKVKRIKEKSWIAVVAVNGKIR